MYNYFRMKQLPKPEYGLMKSLKEYYGFDSDYELFIVALLLMHEVMRFNQPQGNQWIINVINSWRSQKGETRTYELPSKN